jgi:hypothetical protein
MGDGMSGVETVGRRGPADRGVEPTEDERVAAATVLRMIQGIHISRAIYVMAYFGIADLLASGPVHVEALARATQAHEPSLYRVLRLLAALGVLAEDEPRNFRLTVLGDCMRRDAPISVRAWAMLADTLGGIEAFGPIVHTVTTGEAGFDVVHGMKIFEFLAQNRENAAMFDAIMAERTAAFAPSVAAAYDFSPLRTVVDVGGGQGILLATILRQHPHLHGVLFDSPGVAARAELVLKASKVADRCAVVAGDFFASVPPGADAYLLANVLHDWQDHEAEEILKNCRSAMAKGGRVLIVERLIPDDPMMAAPTLLSDFNMLVYTGGQERTNAEYGTLLAAAGLSLGTVQPVAFPYGVIEGLSLANVHNAIPVPAAP